jgi:hypothetical protein
MRLLWVCAMLGAVLALVGCGGGEAGRGNPEDLPVSCVAKPAKGNCRSRQTKYYFDYRDNRCKSFTHTGCGGRVPFETLEDCVNYCGATP